MAIRRVTIRRHGIKPKSPLSLPRRRGRATRVNTSHSGSALVGTTISTVSSSKEVDKEKLEALQKTGITKASIAEMNKKKAEENIKNENEMKLEAEKKKKEEEERKLEAEKKKKEAEEKKAAEAAEKMAQEARRRKLREQMAAKMVAHYTKVPDEYEKPINIVTQADGIYEVRINRIGHFITKTASVKIPGAEQKLKPGFVYKLPRKIPLSFLLHTIKFFKVVNTHYGSEAYQQYFWDEEAGKFFMHYPVQDCSGGHVDYTRDPELEQQKLLIMDIHSHNTMGAFFSGVDDSDEKENRLFGVVGKITQTIPEMKFRISSAGKHVMIHPLKIFDLDHIDEEVAALPEDQREEAKNDLEALAEAINKFSLADNSTNAGGYSYPRGGNGYWDDYGYDYNRRSGAMNYGGGSSFQRTPVASTNRGSLAASDLDPEQVYVIDRSDDVDQVFKEIILKWDDEQIVELVDLLIGSNLGDLIEDCLNDNDDDVVFSEDDSTAGIELETEVPREFIDAEDNDTSWNEGVE